jgi:hypothetical protein
MSVLLSDSINYKQASGIKEQYQNSKSYPIEGLNNYPLANNQESTSTFNIVPNVINLAKSKALWNGQLASSRHGKLQLFKY